ncbi:lipase family protein [Sporobolomyces koalae]|uniref:lipase family protein n=1 Tax=Sporobolomyces koalae TaxID=500713 RepID=UPI0031806B95
MSASNDSNASAASKGKGSADRQHKTKQPVISAFSIPASHASELANLTAKPTDRQSWLSRARNSVPLAFVLYLLNTVTSWCWTLATSPAAILLDPLSTTAALVVYPFVWFGLAIATLVFWLAGLLGGGDLIRSIADKHAHGYSMVQWANPEIFDSESNETMKSARKMLAGKYRTTIPPGADISDDNPLFGVARTVRIFSIPLAKALLLMSALVYERKDEYVRRASDLTAQALRSKDEGQRARLLKEVENELVKSEEVIKQQAETWGFKYEGVSELGSSQGGPFASIFYTSAKSHEDPFIVLTFKGTGPQNFAEFLVDATINRVPAGVFFGAGSGTAHQGFYTSLFMTSDSKRRSGSDAYGTIVRTLAHTALRMKQELAAVREIEVSQVPQIPLWVAGHSLGSALASLFYARCLRSPDDLGTNLLLRDCYSFGTPRLGDGNFTSAFEQSLITPRDRAQILWRVQNHLDIVTMVPPGLADNERGRSTLSVASVLNFAHLGPALVLRPFSWRLFKKRAKTYRVDEIGVFHEAVSVQIADENYRGGFEISQANAASVGYTATSKIRKTKLAFSRAANDWANPLNLLKLLPAPLYDHFPAAYLADLDLMQAAITRSGSQPPTDDLM